MKPRQRLILLVARQERALAARTQIQRLQQRLIAALEGRVETLEVALQEKERLVASLREAIAGQGKVIDVPQRR